MTETSNVYENKNICIKIAEVLLQHGADINKLHNGKSLLMDFCGITMSLNSVQVDMNLEVVKFLLQHGADKKMKCTSNNKSAVDMAQTHCAREKLIEILNKTTQIYFHPKAKN